MSLPNWVEGSIHPSIEITWYRDGSTDPEPLTDATLSGFIGHGAESRAIVGDLVLIDAENGVFRWDLDAADVATAGRLKVQFVASYSSGATPAKTFKTDWRVERSLG